MLRNHVIEQPLFREQSLVYQRLPSLTYRNPCGLPPPSERANKAELRQVLEVMIEVSNADIQVLSADVCAPADQFWKW